MTEEQKDILIAKMLDAPASLSDEELEMILNDSELKDVLETSSAVSGAYARLPEPDMEEEWKRFRPRLRRKPSTTRWVMRVAAIFLGVMLLSGITGKMIDRLFTPEDSPVLARIEMPATVADSLPSVNIAQGSEPTTGISLESVTAKESVAVPGQLIAKTEVAESKRMEKSNGIDVDEFLRIQQARIDNELAIQCAEIYEETFDGLIPLLDNMGMYETVTDNVIERITMQ